MAIYSIRKIAYYMSEDGNCTHVRQGTVMIGYSPKKDSLLYKMSACLDCGLYMDSLGHLASFEQDASEELGREWKWKETHMTAQELESWRPEDNTRIVCIP